jgi:hypothetical protein
MVRKIVERRTVLKGGAAAVGIFGSGASTATVAGVEPASADTAQSPLPEQILTAVERFRATIPANFDPEYVEKAVIPFFLTSFYEGERPMLPMIDVNFSKENALPYDLWGLIYHDWRPTPEEGVTVFLQGLEKRGDNNLRKRIYFSAVTPDLYKPMYGAKVTTFFDKILDQQFANQPFMRHYLDYYFDLYWDLHLGVTGDAIPYEVRQIGEAFNTVLAYRNPLLPITHDNYMKVRELLDFLKAWIDERIGDIQSGKTKNPEKTMAWPQRYLQVPTSAQINDDKCRQIGLARCPFDITNFEVKDGRKANITNSGFGTVFGVVDGTSHPVCDYAGFAPFGFSYRRCPGEQLTIHVFEDFLRKVWRDKIVFRKLNLANPGRVPIGPNAVIQDDLGFSRPA